MSNVICFICKGDWMFYHKHHLQKYALCCSVEYVERQGFAEGIPLEVKRGISETAFKKLQKQVDIQFIAR